MEEAAEETESLVTRTADATLPLTSYFESMSEATFLELAHATVAPAATFVVTPYWAFSDFAEEASEEAAERVEEAMPLSIEENESFEKSDDELRLLLPAEEAALAEPLLALEGDEALASSSSSPLAGIMATATLAPSMRALLRRTAVLAAAADSNFTTASFLPEGAL